MTGVLTGAEIRAQLRKVVASPGFAKSTQLQTFLTAVVEAAIANRGGEVKEYWLGATVLGRGESFDPKADSIVRTEAARLRQRLRQYYESEGAADPIRIELPTGGYVPNFNVVRAMQDSEPEPKRRRSVPWRWILAGSAALVLSAFAGRLPKAVGHLTWSAPVAAHTNSSRSAEDIYLEGRMLWQTRNVQHLHEAISKFQEALETDPRYVDAYVGLADSYGLLAGNGGMNRREAIMACSAAAQKALNLEPTSAWGHAALGLCEYADWRFDEGEKEQQEALRLNPTLTYAWYRLAQVAEMNEDFAEAERALERAAKLDPASAAPIDGLLELYYDWHEFDRGIALARKALAAGGRPEELHWRLAQLLEGNKQMAEALEERRKAVAVAGADKTAALAWLAIDEGRRADALELTRACEREVAATNTAWGLVASLYARLGRNDEALRALDQSWDAHEVDIYSMRWKIDYDPLRTHPRFQALLKKLPLHGAQ